MYFTPPGYADGLRIVGEMLHTMILENYRPWPGWPESSTRTEMRAAVADLRHMQGFLASVGRERELSSLDPEDAYLSTLAAKLARQLKHATDGIERELDGAREAGHRFAWHLLPYTAATKRLAPNGEHLPLNQRSLIRARCRNSTARCGSAALLRCAVLRPSTPCRK